MVPRLHARTEHGGRCGEVDEEETAHRQRLPEDVPVVAAQRRAGQDRGDPLGVVVAQQPPAATLADLQTQLDAFRELYNHQRPRPAHTHPVTPDSATTDSTPPGR